MIKKPLLKDQDMRSQTQKYRSRPHALVETKIKRCQEIRRKGAMSSHALMKV